SRACMLARDCASCRGPKSVGCRSWGWSDRKNRSENTYLLHASFNPHTKGGCMSAEKMGAGIAWLIVLGGSIASAVVSAYVPGFLISLILNLAILGLTGWAAVHMTQATAGKGILAFLVGAVAAAVVAFFIFKSQASAAISGVGTDAMKDALNK